MRNELEPEELRRCQLIIYTVVGLSAFQWQAFVPMLPLLMTAGLDKPLESIGWMYGSFISASVVGFLSLPRLVLHVTPYALLRRGFELRTFSGLVHVVALQVVTLVGGDPEPMLLLSRAVHGFTLLLVPLNVAWIGTVVPNAEKPQALAERNMFATAGITFGILLGSVSTSAVADITVAGAAPGWFLIVSSVAMWVALERWFSDRDMLPTAPENAPAGGPGEVPWLHVILTSGANFVGWAGYTAFEGTLSLLLVVDFGWTTSSVLVGWFPATLGSFLGSYAVSKLRQRQWTTGQIANLASATLVGVGGALLLGVDPSAASEADPEPGYLGLRLSPAARSTCFVLGVSLYLFAFAVNNTTVNATLLVHLPAHLQANFQTPVQLMGMLGRGFGPMAGAMLHGDSDEQPLTTMKGAASVALFAWVVGCLATWVPVAFAQFYTAPNQEKPRPSLL